MQIIPLPAFNCDASVNNLLCFTLSFSSSFAKMRICGRQFLVCGGPSSSLSSENLAADRARPRIPSPHSFSALVKVENQILVNLFISNQTFLPRRSNNNQPKIYLFRFIQFLYCRMFLPDVEINLYIKEIAFSDHQIDYFFDKISCDILTLEIQYICR